MYLCMALGDLNLFIFVNTRAIFRFILSVIYLWYWRWWCNSLIITRHTYICRHLIDSANTDVIKVCYLCKLVRNQGQTRLRIEWYCVDAEFRIVWVLIIWKKYIHRTCKIVLTIYISIEIWIKILPWYLIGVHNCLFFLTCVFC